tara:strand:- start:515 stop:1039 length:525 start_codon:yes stop_codon:yes gene_type:complete
MGILDKECFGYKDVMHKYRYFFLKELPLYSLIVFVSAKVIKAAYILLHNLLEHEQWPFLLLFRSQDLLGNIEKLTSLLVLAPLFETLFFCVIVYRICSKVKISDCYYIIVSASLFSFFHLLRDGSGWYTLAYTFVGGVVFAYFYNKQKAKYNESVAYIFTSLVHFLANFLILCV